MERDDKTTPAVTAPVEQQTSAELVKLIRKLRWIGLEDEARQLQTALNRFPPEERSVVSGTPIECD